MPRLRLTVRGRVQGVGFRWFAAETASRLGMSGWVRNADDGSVQAEAQGDARALSKFVEALKAGPPSAQVASVERREIAEDREESDFDIR